jgi:ATP-dependent RNA helicase DDX18/HAS1
MKRREFGAGQNYDDSGIVEERTVNVAESEEEQQISNDTDKLELNDKGDGDSVVEEVQQPGEEEKNSEEEVAQTTLAETIMKFSSLNLSENTMKAVREEVAFDLMTEVQSKTIPHALAGKDLVVTARTGDGKTLAFLIPAVEKLFKSTSQSGTGVIVITPTREFALQIFSFAQKICKFHNLSIEFAIGGADRKAQAAKLEKGINLLIATPGRLLDHLLTTPNFQVENLQMLIIDELDRTLELGFDKELREIIEKLPANRQSLLFCGARTNMVQEIALVATRNTDSEKAVQIEVDESSKFAK